MVWAALGRLLAGATWADLGGYWTRPKRPPRPPRRPQEAAKTAQEAAKTAPRGSQKTDRHLHLSVLAAKSLQGPPVTPPRLIFDRFLIDLLVDFRSLLGRFLVDFCLIFDSLFDRFWERLLLLFSLFFSLSPSLPLYPSRLLSVSLPLPGYRSMHIHHMSWFENSSIMLIRQGPELTTSFLMYISATALPRWSVQFVFCALCSVFSARLCTAHCVL